MHKLCTLAHTIVNGIAPSYLCELYGCNTPTTDMTSRYGVGRDNLMLQFLGGEPPNKCVFLKLMNTWNNLPVSLRSLNPVDKFKKQLKRIIFGKPILKLIDNHTYLQMIHELTLEFPF